MTERYVNIDRQTAMLLPPDMREWVKEDDLVHFILEAVEGSDLSGAVERTHGGGSKQYPPAMMMALLIYSYAHGIFGSRQIERASHYHIGVRYICANEHPDHDTICTFRRVNRELVKAVFTHVLEVAATMKLLQVGTICVDGTKILANAATRRSLNTERMDQLEAELGKQIEELLVKAEKADAAAHQEGGHLPKELASRQRLRDQISAAREMLAEQVKERAAEREKDRKQWEANPIGDPPRKLNGKVKAKDRINLTDPESVVMPHVKGGYAPSYNAQIGVSGQNHALIVATEVSQQANDRQQVEGMAVKVKEAVLEVKSIVVDSGYDHARQIAQTEGRLGVEIYCPPQKAKDPAAKEPKKKHRYHEARVRSREIRAKMREKADSVEGRKLLHVRRTTAEPVFGMVKSVLGFRQFRLRGLEKVRIEWQLVALAFNCRRIAGQLGKN
jgi:transposase